MPTKQTGKRDRRKKKVVTPKERLKMEIAAELGLLDKVKRDGWESLTLAECGRVGGILARRMKELNITE
ncbi:MAG: small, acid-soluble spore protein, alpha/beta type [Syntrophomonadaceae bacterium]|nr:small, acid-soluble spore protein, alpha/beta type [Syntrophomonadaceae bacterium]